MNDQTKSIYGIPCEITDTIVCSAVAEVFGSVQSNHPKDWDFICEKLRKVSLYDGDDRRFGKWHTPVELRPPHPIRDFDKEYLSSLPLEERGMHAMRHDRVEFWPGEIQLVPDLNDDLSYDEIVAVVAHELGHVATRMEDMDERSGIWDEWASEGIANMYGFHWGFEKQLRLFHQRSDWVHNGPLPGDVYTRDFCDMHVDILMNDDFKLIIFDRSPTAK